MLWEHLREEPNLDWGKGKKGSQGRSLQVNKSRKYVGSMRWEKKKTYQKVSVRYGEQGQRGVKWI